MLKSTSHVYGEMSPQITVMQPKFLRIVALVSLIYLLWFLFSTQKSLDTGPQVLSASTTIITHFKEKVTHDQVAPKTPLALPTEYTPVPYQSPFCADHFGASYIEKLRDSAASYCASGSPSDLTCFHTQVSSDDRIDTFCLARDATFHASQQLFSLKCELQDPTSSSSPFPIPKYGEFSEYWYHTGPGIVFNESIYIDDNFGQSPSRGPISNYTILVNREGPFNLWHSLMEIFSMTMTMDVLQITQPRNSTRPYFNASDIDNTQVLILDDGEDGPYYDLWSLFSKSRPLRLKDFPRNASARNLIIPLAGGSNPMWQGDWKVHSCEDSSLLRTFARRVLDFYEIGDTKPRQVPDITLTFINRTGSRKLIDSEKYLNMTAEIFRHVKIQSVDFATLSFKEQLRVVQQTDILVGVHGAGLTHGMFLPAGSTMVEILPSGLNHKGFRNLASLMGHSYLSTHASGIEREAWHGEDVFLEKGRFLDLIGIAIRTMYNKGERSYDVN